MQPTNDEKRLLESANMLIKTCSPIIQKVDPQDRLYAFDLLMLETLAGIIGPVATIEHLRLVADASESRFMRGSDNRSSSAAS